MLLDLVRKVIGQRTTDIVLKHYFQQGRDDFCRTLQSAMPKQLNNGHKAPKEEMRELLDQVKPKPPMERTSRVSLISGFKALLSRWSRSSRPRDSTSPSFEIAHRGHYQNSRAWLR